MNLRNISLILLMFSGCTSIPSPAKLASSTVMITNLQRNSGGSGSIIKSYNDQSFILTNGHVCKVAKNGGYVITDTREAYSVVSYVMSEKHDLCLIKVAADLHTETPIASRAPATYDSATISGHPHLLPTIITFGHFSGKHVVTVMIGYRDCSPEEATDPQLGIFCAMSGGKLPDLRNYQAVVVSATIMPGSSGSAIYNDKGEISALVFAGAGELGYSESVPYEYISYFLTQEIITLREQIPNTSVDLIGGRMNSHEYSKLVKGVCEEPVSPIQETICSYVEQDAQEFK